MLIQKVCGCVANQNIISLITACNHLQLRRSYPDDVNKTTPLPYQVCILYSACDKDPSGSATCLFHYGRGGACSFAEATFGIIATIAIVYIVISLVRVVLATE